MFNNILVPIDGSPLSYKPVAAAIEMAKTRQGRLVLLSVAEPRLFNASDEESLATGAVVEEQHAAKAQANLAQAVEAARQAGVSCEPLVMQSRLPYDEIVAVAQRANCDAIFMATRGKMGMLDQLFDESTTRQVLQKTTVPVLVFP
nr:universal stress protein [uncultured Noviherbaspirillum sp.]